MRGGGAPVVKGVAALLGRALRMEPAAPMVTLVTFADPSSMLTALPRLLTGWGALTASVSDISGGDRGVSEPSRMVVTTGLDRVLAARLIDEAVRSGMRVVHNERDEARLSGPDVELVIEAPVEVRTLCAVAALATLLADASGFDRQEQVGRALNDWVMRGQVADHRVDGYPQDPALFEVLAVLLADRLRDMRGWEPTATVSTFLVRPALVAASYSPVVVATAKALTRLPARSVEVPRGPSRYAPPTVGA